MSDKFELLRKIYLAHMRILALRYRLLKDSKADPATLEMTLYHAIEHRNQAHRLKR